MQRKFLRGAMAGLVFPLVAAAADGPQLTGAGCESFGFDFYRKLSGTEPYRFQADANVAISPLSLAGVLQAFRLGASGEVKAELDHVLEPPGPLAGEYTAALKPGGLKNQAVQFSVANSLWPDKRFVLKKTFVEAAFEQLGAAVIPADFSQPEKAANKINTWIGDHTAGHIKDLLKPDAVKGASLAVANAVYFKGDWEKPFPAAKTEEEPFHLASGKTAQVPMMNQTAACRYAEKDGVKVLELPYAGGEISMVLLLPPPGAESWAALEASLTEGEGGYWFSNTIALTNMSNRTVTIKLPRWKITCEPPDCIGVLKATGVTRMFSPSGDFAGISDQGPLYVSAFLHRTWMEVNEKGTEAAAATVGVMTRFAIIKPPEPAAFVADRPFLFVIWHRASGTPLFVGRVSNPGK